MAQVPIRPDQGTSSKPLWKRWWVWVLAVVVVLIGLAQTQGDRAPEGQASPTDQLTPADQGPGCDQPATAWLETLQSGFYRDFRSAGITGSGYVKQDTDQGVAYSVAVTVEGVSGVAVFGTSNAPLQSDPGLVA